jgi:hypothetical protein
VQLAAAEWISRRRLELSEMATEALRWRSLAWTGSRHQAVTDVLETRARVADVVEGCMGEGLIPSGVYMLRARIDDGFGIPSVRCVLRAALADEPLRRVREVVQIGLVPWNRTVVREGVAHPIIRIETRTADWGRGPQEPGLDRDLLIRPIRPQGAG